MKKFLIVILFVLASDGITYGQNSISYTIRGLENTRVYLSAVHGSRHDPVDSCFSVNGHIEFKNKTGLPAGVYRISFRDSLFTDIICNNEQIVITNDINNLAGSISVVHSEENKIYYEYWQMSAEIHDSIDQISTLGNALYEASNHKMNPALDSLALKVYQLSDKLDKYTLQLVSKSHGLYVGKLLKAFVTPNWYAYKKLPGAKIYKSKHEFLKEHFFDNVDFSDSTLLNSEVFYVLCNDYLSRFCEPESDSNYIAAVDFILGKAQACPPVYNYILNLFINTFEDTEWEGTFIHLVDEHLEKNTCASDGYDKNLSERSAALKKLRPGNKAPEILLNDVAGKPVSLYSVKARVTLLLFWSSECEHCEDVLPQIQQIYAGYHPLGLEVFAVSVDTDKNTWINAIKRQGTAWINVSDLKGFTSPVVAAFDAYSTPTFFLLDAEKNIISHPYSPKQMTEGLQKAFGK
ncbi:MAG TPA: redoxin domain-containing protein [Bacteroidales bacterium]|nr:redoxin domain-containing protein [Bacteroidales bacterium]